MTDKVIRLPVNKVHQSAGDMLREQAERADLHPELYVTCVVLNARANSLADWTVFGDLCCTRVIGFIEVAKREMLDGLLDGK